METVGGGAGAGLSGQFGVSGLHLRTRRLRFARVDRYVA